MQALTHEPDKDLPDANNAPGANAEPGASAEPTPNAEPELNALPDPSTDFSSWAQDSLRNPSDWEDPNSSKDSSVTESESRTSRSADQTDPETSWHAPGQDAVQVSAAWQEFVSAEKLHTSPDPIALEDPEAWWELNVKREPKASQDSRNPNASTHQNASPRGNRGSTRGSLPKALQDSMNKTANVKPKLNPNLPKPKLLTGNDIPHQGKLFFFGVVLPLIAVVFECTFHYCARHYFDPFPTSNHVILFLLIPLSNYLTLLASKRNLSAHYSFMSLASGMAMGMGAMYSLMFLPLLGSSLFFVGAFGFGLLGLAPALSLPCTFLSGKKVCKLSSAGKTYFNPHQVEHIGHLIILVMVLAVELPSTLTRVYLGLAAAPATSADGIRWLRKYGNEEVMLRACYERSGRATDIIGSVYEAGHPLPIADARSIFYKVTGKPFNSVPIPASARATIQHALAYDPGGMNANVEDEFDLDTDIAGQSVSGVARGLAAANTGISGIVDGNAMMANLDFSYDLKNASKFDREGRAKILLPNGAVVTSATLTVKGKEHEATIMVREAARAIYQQAVMAHKEDPLLVSTCGADQILVQCFPVHPDDSIKVKLHIVSPLAFDKNSDGALPLPTFVERNFQADTPLNIDVNSNLPLSISGLGTPVQSNQNTKLENKTAQAEQKLIWQLSAKIDPKAFAGLAPIIHSSRNHDCKFVFCHDTFVPSDLVLARSIREQPILIPRSLVVLIDGSVGMKDQMAETIKGLAALPPTVPTSIMLIGDDTNSVPKILCAPGTRPGSREFQHALDALAKYVPAGGHDNSQALVQYLNTSNLYAGIAVLWLHSAQPIMMPQEDAQLRAALARHINAARVQVFHGQAPHNIGPVLPSEANAAEPSILSNVRRVVDPVPTPVLPVQAQAPHPALKPAVLPSRSQLPVPAGTPVAEDDVAAQSVRPSQPLQTEQATPTEYARQPLLYDLQIAAGPVEILNGIEYSTSFKRVDRVGSISEDLQQLVKSWKTHVEMPSSDFAMYPDATFAGPGTVVEETDKSLAQMYAFDRVVSALENPQASNSFVPNQLSRQCHLITPVSSAVVNDQDSDLQPLPRPVPSAWSEFFRAGTIDDAYIVVSQNMNNAVGGFVDSCANTFGSVFNFPNNLTMAISQSFSTITGQLNRLNAVTNADRQISYGGSSAGGGGGYGGNGYVAGSQAPQLQGATNGTIGPQGDDAVVTQGVNTAGTVSSNRRIELFGQGSVGVNSPGDPRYGQSNEVGRVAGGPSAGAGLQQADQGSGDAFDASNATGQQSYNSEHYTGSQTLQVAGDSVDSSAASRNRQDALGIPIRAAVPQAVFGRLRPIPPGAPVYQGGVPISAPAEPMEREEVAAPMPHAAPPPPPAVSLTEGNSPDALDEFGSGARKKEKSISGAAAAPTLAPSALNFRSHETTVAPPVALTESAPIKADQIHSPQQLRSFSYNEGADIATTAPQAHAKEQRHAQRSILAAPLLKQRLTDNSPTVMSSGSGDVATQINEPGEVNKGLSSVEEQQKQINARQMRRRARLERRRQAILRQRQQQLLREQIQHQQQQQQMNANYNNQGAMDRWVWFFDALAVVALLFLVRKVKLAAVPLKKK